jgi:hypothetical protein
MGRSRYRFCQLSAARSRCGARLKCSSMTGGRFGMRHGSQIDWL